MEKETKEIILSMGKEFDELEGYVTCEISIHKDSIVDMENFLKEDPNTDIKLGKWVAMECDTCVGHHGEGYVHVSIERFKTIIEMEKASNFIKILDNGR